MNSPLIKKSNTLPKKTSNAPKKARRRLEPAERQQMILEGAIIYFAENGFEGRTRDLAEYLGISQSLLYRYFPNMGSLIERIYESVYVGRWNSNWDSIIADRSVPLTERLKSFYKDYHHGINRYDTMRITMFTALRGENIASRYFGRVRERLIQPIVEEIRHTYGMKSTEEMPVHALEEELVYGLHGMVIYSCLREHVFNLPTQDPESLLIDIYVDNFVAGVEDSFKRVHGYVKS